MKISSEFHRKTRAVIASHNAEQVFREVLEKELRSNSGFQIDLGRQTILGKDVHIRLSNLSMQGWEWLSHSSHDLFYFGENIYLCWAPCSSSRPEAQSCAMLSGMMHIEVDALQSIQGIFKMSFETIRLEGHFKYSPDPSHATGRRVECQEIHVELPIETSDLGIQLLTDSSIGAELQRTFMQRKNLLQLYSSLRAEFNRTMIIERIGKALNSILCELSDRKSSHRRGQV
jgi:hypothetical protein